MDGPFIVDLPFLEMMSDAKSHLHHSADFPLAMAGSKNSLMANHDSISMLTYVDPV